MGGLNFYSSNVALADAMKMARPFTPTDDYTPYADLDENLYPRSVPEGGLEAIVINRWYPEGDYVVTWERSSTAPSTSSNMPNERP